MYTLKSPHGLTMESHVYNVYLVLVLKQLYLVCNTHYSVKFLFLIDSFFFFSWKSMLYFRNVAKE